MTRKVMGLALLAAVMVMGAAKKSEAAFIAYICDTATCSGTQNSNWFALADGAAVGSISGDGSANGFVALTVNVGGLTVLFNGSQSKPGIGSASKPMMDMDFIATGVGTVWFYASDTDFTGTLPVTGILSANWAGSASIQACIDGMNSNLQLALTNQSCTPTFTTSPVTGIFGHAGATVNPFSMTLGIQMSRTTQGTVTGDFLVDTVPEPGSLILLGTGLLGLAAVARRRFAR